MFDVALWAVALALILDALLGEPNWLWSRVPHPAVLMGRAVSFADDLLNAKAKRDGVVAIVALVAVAMLIGLILQLLPGAWAEVIVGAVLLAQRSLVDHVAAVANNLRISVKDGQEAVAMIVGRETAQMDEAAVSRAAIESGAENFSDGVIAPLFWFVLAGLPGLIAYKMINTADSMIGYRTEKYEQFGWAAAKLDDIVNWVPARLTALLIRTAARHRASWSAIRADAALHRSPNAGWPEAAMAPAIGVALSGPRAYDGEMQDFPWVNAGGRKNADPDDIEASIVLLWQAWIFALGGVIALAAVQGVIALF